MKPQTFNIPFDPDMDRVAQLEPSHLVSDSLGIVVFGPGEGESILIRFPDNSIGIVDGCGKMDKDGVGNPVLDFLGQLRNMQNDLLTIRFICMTHPHDDHYLGLKDILAQDWVKVLSVWTTAIPFECKKKGYATILEHHRNKPGKTADEGIIKDFLDLLEAFEPFNECNHWKSIIPDRSLIRAQEGLPSDLEVIGCAPADQDIRSVAQLIISDCEEGPALAGLGNFRDPNTTSAALIVRWGNARVLLSGDLLAGSHVFQTHQGQGFKAGIDDHLFQNEFQVVKVSHHASHKAHDPILWNLIKPKLALVTPFRHGSTGKRNQPPRPECINYLAGKAINTDDGATGSVVVVTNPLDWDKDSGNPVPMGKKLRQYYANSARTFRDKAEVLPRVKPKRNLYSATAVSLDKTGRILRLVLAGDADIYLHPEEAATVSDGSLQID